jgi:hypothetical protein
MHKVSDAVRSTHGQDGAVVLDLRQGQIFSFNLVGSRILALLESGARESDVVDAVSRDFGIGRDIAGGDVHDFIEQLQNLHLVE